MSESFEEIRARLMRDASQGDEELRRFIKQGLTEEKLQSDWDRLRGADATRRGAPRERVSVWREFFYALSVRKVPQIVGVAVSALTLVAVGWLTLHSTPIELRTPDEWKKAGGSFPWELRLELSANRAMIEESGSRFVAQLAVDRSTASENLQVFDLRFEGISASGETNVFSGTLILTNAPGIAQARKQKELRGARLLGTLKVGLQPEVSVDQDFLPY